MFAATFITKGMKRANKCACATSPYRGSCKLLLMSRVTCPISIAQLDIDGIDILRRKLNVAVFLLNPHPFQMSQRKAELWNG